MTNNNAALIIFVRNPEPGKVKTRIGAVAGNHVALAIYCKLLQHTRDITIDLAADKYVYYADKINAHDLWNQDHYYKAKQEGPDLGTRMHTAFSTLFQKGYEKACIIGSDCYELTGYLIHRAFEELNNADIVIGPALDGGYYLLGMNDGVKDIFSDIAWSTSKVLEQTLDKLQGRYTYTLLPALPDIDTLQDVPTSWLRHV